jgi:hypothetical protein
MNMAKRAIRAADELQQRHAWLAVPVAVWKKFGDDEAGNLAALVAYYAFVAPYTEQDRRAYQLYAQVEKRAEGMDIAVGGEDDREKTSG